MLLVSWVIAGMSSGRLGVQGALVAVEKCAVNLGCWNKGTLLSEPSAASAGCWPGCNAPPKHATHADRQRWGAPLIGVCP